MFRQNDHRSEISPQQSLQLSEFLLTSLANSEGTKTTSVEKEDEKDLTRKEESKESENDLKAPAKDVDILKRTESSEGMTEMEGKRTPQTKKPLNKSHSVSNVGNGGGKSAGERKSSNLTARTKQSSLPPASRLANGRKDHVPALKLTVKYNKATSVLSLVVHKGRVLRR